MSSKPTEDELLFQSLCKFFPDFAISIHDIKNPSASFVQDMYKRILVEFNVDISSLMQPHFRQMELYKPHSELYHDIIPVLNLMSAIKKFNVIPNFGLLDLTYPEPKRNLEQMTAFIKFVDFADDKLTELEEKFEIVKNMKKQDKSLKSKIKQLKEGINNRANLLSEQPEWEITYKNLLDEQKIILNENELISEQMKKVEELNNEKMRSVDKLTEQLDMLEKEMGRMRGQIVDSPTAVVQEMESLHMKKAACEEDLENLKDKLQMKKQQIDQLNDLLNKQEKRTEELSHLIVLIQETQDKKKTVEALVRNIDDVIGKRDESKFALKKLETKVQALKKEMSNVQTQWKAEEDLLVETLEAIKRECRELKLHNEEAVRQKDELEEYKSICEAKIKECYKMINNYNMQYEDVLKQAKENAENTLERTDKNKQILHKLLKKSE